MTPTARYLRRRFPVAAVIALAAVSAAIIPARAQVIIEETTPTPAPPRPHRKRPKPPMQPTGATPEAVAAGAGFVAPKLLWRTLLHRCDGTPACDGGAVFTTSESGLYLLDAGGHTVGMSEIGPTEATPSLDANRVYVGTDRGAVYGADRHTGKILWKFGGATDAVLTTPAVGAGRLYVESSDNAVYGLAALTGGQIWKFVRPDGSLGYSSPVYMPADSLAIAVNPATQQPTFAGGTDALFVCGDNTLYRLDPTTGHQVWHTPVGGKSLSTPALGGGRVYVGGDGPGLTALALGDGHQVWSFGGKGDREWFGAPTVADGFVFVATTARYVYAVDAATGKPRWNTRLLTGSVTSPAVDARRHVVYVSSMTNAENPTLTALDTRTGAKLWDAKIGSLNGSPLVVGDKLYAASTDGFLYCYGLTK